MIWTNAHERGYRVQQNQSKLAQHMVEGLFAVRAAQMGNSLKAQMEFKEQQVQWGNCCTEKREKTEWTNSLREKYWDPAGYYTNYLSLS